MLSGLSGSTILLKECLIGYENDIASNVSVEDFRELVWFSPPYMAGCRGFEAQE
jgi:hypothetical protein